MRRLRLLALAVVLVSCSHSKGKDVFVFAASSLTIPLQTFAPAYHAAHPDSDIKLNLGGTQDLSHQLESHAPCDVFISAGSDWLHTLAKQGFVSDANLVPFASNKLCIAVPSSNPAKITSFADLAKPGIKLVIAAAPVPAGKAARKALANQTKLSPSFEDKVLANVVSQETSVRAVVTKVAFGAADAGIVYVTDALSESPNATLIQIPDSVNVPVEYYAVIPKGADQSKARAFLAALSSPVFRQTLTKMGFELNPK